MAGRTRFSLLLGCSFALASLYLHAQAPNITYERLTRAAKEAQNWLTYSGTYMSQRYSTLNQINPSNVKTLEQKWAYQGAVVGPWQSTPLVVKGKVIIGVGGGDLGIRGFIAAYDAPTGKEGWRFYTIPGPGEPGHETWKPCPPSSSTSPDSPTYCDREAWKHGGGSIWVTGSYDPDLNLTYWGIGNVWPDYNPNQRPGDNLYTESVVALDADTGRLRWHFQFTPAGAYDYDSVQIPVLADLNLSGSLAKVMLWANRNGFFYVLDRATGRFLLGRPFVKVNWASDLDERGRPIQTPQPPGSPTWPGNQGGTNWYSPSFSPRTGLVYVSAWEDYATVFPDRTPNLYVEGRSTVGSGGRQHVPVKGARALPALGRGPINNWTEAVGHGAVKAIDPRTGMEMWKFSTTDGSTSGIMAAGSGLLLTRGRRSRSSRGRIPLNRRRHGTHREAQTVPSLTSRIGRRSSRIRVASHSASCRSRD